MFKQLFIISFISCVFCFSEAKELKGMKFDDTVAVGKTILKLNGLGVRRFMVFDVYVGGLYLETLSQDPAVIVNSKSIKQVTLKFKRWVEKGKMQEAWTEGFSKNKEPNYEYRADLKKLNEAMTHLNENDVMTFTFYDDHTDIKVKDSAVQTIQGQQFSKTMLKVFLGDPPDSGLKKGMLGL